MQFRYDNSVNDSGTGVAVQGVEVYVLTQPADITDFPPSPLATLYADPNGLVPLANPVITDGFGNYFFYTGIGFYTLYIYDPLGRIDTEILPDQEIGSPSTESGGGIVSVLSLTGQSGSISGTLFPVASTGAGMYRATVDLICTTPGFPGNASAEIAWNNGTTSAFVTSYQPLNLAVIGELAGQSEEFYAAANTNITYSVTVTGGAGSVYAVRIRLEYLEAVSEQFFTTYVQSVNGLSSIIDLVAGANMTITQIGQTLTFSASGGGGGINPPAGDIGGSTGAPTVVSTHLASPLPIAQGGTGTATPGIVAGSGIAVSGSFPNQTVTATGGGGGGGGIAFNMTPVSASFAASTFNNFYECTTGSATLTATLPTAIGNKNQILAFIKIDAGVGTLVIQPVGGQTIMGFANFTLQAAYQFVLIISDGSQWLVWSRN